MRRRASSISASRPRAPRSCRRSMAASRPPTVRCSKKGRRLAATPSRKRAGSPILTASCGKPSSPTAKRQPTAIAPRSARCRTASVTTNVVCQSMRPETPTLARRLLAEGVGSFFLFACVIGSGIMAQNLSNGNDAIALLGNTLATGAILFVLITMLGPISGAHMNPAVSLVALSRRELSWSDAAAYIVAQLTFGILGAWAAHLMFDLPTLQLSMKARTGLGQWAGEFIATFGLILTILGTVRFRREWVPAGVALYITAAYWFTSSTSFANPAITVARSITNTFAGIAPHDVPLFIFAQLLGAACAALVAKVLFDPSAE